MLCTLVPFLELQCIAVECAIDQGMHSILSISASSAGSWEKLSADRCAGVLRRARHQSPRSSSAGCHSTARPPAHQIHLQRQGASAGRAQLLQRQGALPWPQDIPVLHVWSPQCRIRLSDLLSREPVA